MIVRVPAGALVVLIGPSSSGKSTFAARRFPPTEVLSSDAFRALVADDENDQAATPDAFELLHRVLDRRLRRRRVSVVDATNVERSARRELLTLARSRRAPTVAVVLDVPLAVCLARNERRGERRIPEAALRRQHARMERSLAALTGEGFGAVFRLEGVDEVEGSVVSREPALPGPRGRCAAQRNAPKELRPFR
jgi:protein phosphatase